MEVEHRARCHTHPTQAAVATCGVCGRWICLDCAIPVRGQVVGVECLEKVLPDPPLPSNVLSARPRRERFDRAAMAGFAAVAICSMLPWNRFGVGDGPFGAWGLSPWRWSSPIGPLAIAGILAALLASRPARPVAPVRRAALYLAVGAALLALTLLAIARPPAFSHANAVPWVAGWIASVLVVLSGWVLTNRLKWAKRSAA